MFNFYGFYLLKQSLDENFNNLLRNLFHYLKYLLRKTPFILILNYKVYLIAYPWVILNYFKTFLQLLHNSSIFLLILYSIFLNFDFLHLKIFIVLSYLKVIFHFTNLPFIEKVLHHETKPVSFQLLVPFHLFFKYICINHFFLLIFLILIAPISFDPNKLLKIRFHFKPLFSQIYHSNCWQFLKAQDIIT